jgi:hypothetical protein
MNPRLWPWNWIGRYSNNDTICWITRLLIKNQRNVITQSQLNEKLCIHQSVV